MKRMKRLSFQWRITLLTAILIAGTCICLNLLLYRSGTVSMDSLNGFVMKYDTGNSDVVKIEFECGNCIFCKWQSPQTIEKIFTANGKYRSGQSYQHTS